VICDGVAEESTLPVAPCASGPAGVTAKDAAEISEDVDRAAHPRTICPVARFVRRAALALLMSIVAMGLLTSATRAQTCAANQVDFGGVCVTCPGLTVPNDAHTACVSCPSGSHPSSDGGACVESGGMCQQDGKNIRCAPSASCEPIAHSGGQLPNAHCVMDCKEGQVMDDSRICQPVCTIPGEFYGSGGHCLRCPSGTVTTDDHLACTGCPSGLVPSPSQAYCIKPGTCTWPQFYSPTKAANPCVSCPSGQVANQALGGCETDCRGIGILDPWTRACEQCTGATVPDDHAWSCIGCKDGVPASNHSACVPCAPGKAPNAGHSACIACRGNTISFDGLACVECKYGRSDPRHTICRGPVYNPPHVRPLTTNPAVPRQPGGPVIGPGLLEGSPGLGTQSPAGAGSRVPRAGGTAR